ncbi:MAG: HAMP domain-containing histidine kinase [Anaerolineae bacterium]|nr:HAMP domain-containing histidine kinase [Anaerolineae bacterium]
MSIRKFVAHWLEVPSIDPEDSRRRRLLNILLFGMLVLSFLLFSVSLIVNLINPVVFKTQTLYIYGALALIGEVVIYLINRYGSGEIAGSLFVGLFVVLSAVSDEPIQVVEGRALFAFTIPILMASVILRPWASFPVAALSGGILSFIAFTELGAEVPPLPAILGFFAIAMVSWLSSRSLENALADLRVLNAELDQRVQDRTRELSEANNELMLAYEKLKEVDRLKSRFVSMVSHELRTPVSAIQGFAEMMEAGVYGPVTEGQQAALSRIQANDQRLLGLLNDLLDQARMEAGQLSLHIAHFAVEDLIQEMESTMRVLVEAKGLYLASRIEEGVPPVAEGDVKRLHQILVNLVNNALKFTERGGVTVRVYAPDLEHWAMDVSDTGPGIPPEALTYIFEPFRQVDSSVTREHKGFGLGLAIVKQLAELMGGKVSVVSTLGKGSTFTVWLPCIPSVPAQKETSSSPTSR